MLKNRYRIITDCYGYQAQIKPWWFPFWLSIGITSKPTIEGARELIERHKGSCNVVEYID